MVSDFGKLWASICEKHAGMAEPAAKVHITSKELRSLCQQFHNAGWNSGVAARGRGEQRLSDPQSVFGRIFGF